MKTDMDIFNKLADSFFRNEEMMPVQEGSSTIHASEEEKKRKLLKSINEFIKDIFESEGDDNSIIYHSLQLWSRIHDGWLPDCWPLYSQSALSSGIEKEYENFHNRFYGERKCIDFSFVEFVSKTLKIVPYVFDIHLENCDSAVNPQIKYDGYGRVCLRVSCDEKSVDENYIIQNKENYNQFVKEICNKLQLRSKINQDEVFREFYKFLCAYKREFRKNQVSRVLLISSKLKTETAGDVGYGGAIIVGKENFNRIELDDPRVSAVAIRLNLMYRTIGVDDWTEQFRYASVRSAIAAIMSRNMSHNIGSHVLVRLAQESLSGNVTYGRGAPSQSDITFDPMQLVIEDAYKALGRASKSRILLDDEFLRHRIGAAIHYLEAVHDQVDPNAKPGKSKQEAFAQDCRVLVAYVQARMDFIAQICTERPNWTISSCLCHDVMAHFFQQSKILEHIAASENLTAARFEYDGKLLAPPAKHGRIKFVIRYGKTANGLKPILNFNETDKKPTVDGSQRIPISFPGGRGGWHAFYVIIEGMIRNAAKHAYGKYAEKYFHHAPPPDLEIVIDVIDGATIKDRPGYTVRVYTNVDVDRKAQRSDKEGKLENLSDVLQKKLKTDFTQPDGKLNMKNWGFAEIRSAAGYLQQAEIMDIGSEDQKIVKIRKLMPQNRSRFTLVCSSKIRLTRRYGTAHVCRCKALWNAIKNIRKNRRTRILYFRPSGKIKPCRYPLPTSNRRLSNKHNSPIVPVRVLPQFCYEFNLLKPQIIGLETTDATTFPANAIRLNEGWHVFNDENENGGNKGKHTRSFEFFVIDGRMGTGTKFGQALVKLLKTSATDLEKQNKKDAKVKEENEGNLQKLVHYPGRLFVLYDDKNGIPITNRHAQLRRICVLEDCTELSECYQTKGTEAAAKLLHQKWLEHWLRYRTNTEAGNIQLSIYHYLTEGDASGGEATYLPDTTPYQIKDEKDGTDSGKNEFSIVGNGSEKYALVFGRHWGVLQHENNASNVTVRDQGKRPFYGQCLYAEAMTGGASYFSYAKHEIENGVVNRNILSLAESALMRVVIIDERVQEQFIKQTSSVLVGTAEQQVFVGYLNDTTQSGNDFSQKKPHSDADIYKTGYVDVNFASVAGQNEITSAAIELARSLDTSGSIKSKTEFLWAEKGKFEPDMLIIHQGILDNWANECKIEPKQGEGDDDKGDYARYCPKDKPDKKQAQIGILLDELRKAIPFVVITSGRGKPSQVPEGTSFIPLSVFDVAPKSTMYEKFPLVSQILAIVEKEEEQ